MQRDEECLCKLIDTIRQRPGMFFGDKPKIHSLADMLWGYGRGWSDAADENPWGMMSLFGSWIRDRNPKLPGNIHFNGMLNLLSELDEEAAFVLFWKYWGEFLPVHEEYKEKCRKEHEEYERKHPPKQ